MATRKTKHPPKGERRRRLTLFFNKDARKSAADALKKASWLLAAANAYLGFAKESVAYLVVVIVGWLVAQTLAVVLLSLEEEQGSQEPEEQGHARPPGIVGKRAQQEPVLATYAFAWVVLDLWGAAALALAYRSRLHERAGQLHPRPHSLFPHR